MSYFKNKVIWVTGASSGIGEALVYALAKEGAKLVLSARREDALKQVATNAQLTKETSLILPFDLSNTSQAKLYTEQIIQQFGKIDILINNGGQSQRSESSQTPEEIERHLMEVNYFSAVNLTKAVLPYLLKQESGHVVIISSIAGKFGFYLRSSYSAAKHALHGYFESLRLETEKKGIHTLIVCPGKIKTNVSINAINESGTTHNQMDESHENAMTAEECAQKILKAIIQKKEEILVGRKELLAVYIKRFFPKLFGKIIRKQSPY